MRAVPNGDRTRPRCLARLATLSAVRRGTSAAWEAAEGIRTVEGPLGRASGRERVNVSAGRMRCECANYQPRIALHPFSISACKKGPYFYAFLDSCLHHPTVLDSKFRLPDGAPVCTCGALYRSISPPTARSRAQFCLGDFSVSALYYTTPTEFRYSAPGCANGATLGINQNIIKNP